MQLLAVAVRRGQFRMLRKSREAGDALFFQGTRSRVFLLRRDPELILKLLGGVEGGGARDRINATDGGD